MSKSDCTLDTLIEEHAKYLNSITHKGLLGSTKGGREGSLMGQLHELLKVIMSYKEGMVHNPLLDHLPCLYRVGLTVGCVIRVFGCRVCPSSISQQTCRRTDRRGISPLRNLSANLRGTFFGIESNVVGRMGKYISRPRSSSSRYRRHPDKTDPGEPTTKIRRLNFSVIDGSCIPRRYRDALSWNTIELQRGTNPTPLRTSPSASNTESATCLYLVHPNAFSR